MPEREWLPGGSAELLPRGGARPDRPLLFLSLGSATGEAAEVREIAWARVPPLGAASPVLESYPLVRGKAPAVLLRRLLAAAEGADVHSESAVLDRMRLDRLFADAGLVRDFPVRSFAHLVGARTDPGLVQAARTAAERLVPGGRNAATELSVLLETFRLCRLYSG